MSYADLGRRLDVNAMLDAALAVGRSGNPLTRVADEIRTAIHGTTVAPVVTFDQTALKASLSKVAASVASSPTGASIRSSTGGYVGGASSTAGSGRSTRSPGR